MCVAPGPETVRTMPSWEWLQLPVDPARSRVAVTAARVAPALERTLGLPGVEAERRLTTLPGVGIWTAAEVRQRAHGDPDAASFGDYHVPGHDRLHAGGGAGRRRAAWPSCWSRTGGTGSGCSGWWSCAAAGSPAAAPGWGRGGTCPAGSADPRGHRPRSPLTPGPPARPAWSSRIQPLSGAVSWQMTGKPSSRPHAGEPREW